MVYTNNDGLEYCDCLDWNAEMKEHQLSTMSIFNHKMHTTGVTEQERRAFYITSEDRTPEEIELGDKLQKLVK